jgi:hypothetical protein
MKSKEKALRLCQQYGLITFATKYNDGYTLPLEMAKQCALIAVNEIIKECYKWAGGDNGEWDNKRFEYWEEVKQEINKL